MVLPRFSSLQNLSETTKAGNSDLVWRELLVANHNFVNHCFHKSEDQVGAITKSLQNWVVRKDFKEYKEKDSNGRWVVTSVNEGEIFIADLGLSYETAFSHPVLLIDKIGEKVLVVPLTSASLKVSNAYHPTSNPTGDTKYRKVYSSDGFESDSALMIDSPLVIRQGRLLELKGKLNEDILDPNSIFQEIRESIFKILFNDFYAMQKTLLTEIEELKVQNETLKKQLQK